MADEALQLFGGAGTSSEYPIEKLFRDARAALIEDGENRVLTMRLGMPAHHYVLATRLEQARNLLTLSEMPVAHIAQECGFSSQSHLTAAFRAAHAVTPAQFRSRLTRFCTKSRCR